MKTQPGAPVLIPQPVSYIYKPGTFMVRSDTGVVVTGQETVELGWPAKMQRTGFGANVDLAVVSNVNFAALWPFRNPRQTSTWARKFAGDLPPRSSGSLHLLADAHWNMVTEIAHYQRQL